MIRNRELLLFLLLAFGFGTAVQAGFSEASGNSYRHILASNVFRLKPPNIQPPPPALSRLTLLGITTILGNKLALLRVQFPATPPEPAREKSCILAEGERDGELEVVVIDEQARTVTVNNSGTEVVLTFEKDGLKLSSTSLPTNLPPSPGQSTLGGTMQLNRR